MRDVLYHSNNQNEACTVIFPEAKQKSVSLFLEALYRGKISVIDESSFAHSLRLRSKFIKNEFIRTNDTEMRFLPGSPMETFLVKTLKI